MKVPELEEQQGRNIYLPRSEYLSNTMLPWTTPSPFKKKVAHFERTTNWNYKSLIPVWANNDHILGRRFRNGINLAILIIQQYSRSINGTTYNIQNMLPLGGVPKNIKLNNQPKLFYSDLFDV